jgi:pSer/pThr/pTyr-binding forkhead associated (FHA) protein
VNEQRLAPGEAVLLRLGDQIRVGVTTLAVAGVTAAPAAPPDPTLLVRGQPPDPTGAFYPVHDITPVNPIVAGLALAASAVADAPTPKPPPAPAFFLQSPDGNETLVGHELRVGRDPSCQLVLADPKISRYHAVVLVKEGELFVRDEGSRNGTFVAGARLEAGHLAPLRPGDELRLGETTLTVGLRGEPPAAEGPA